MKYVDINASVVMVIWMPLYHYDDITWMSCSVKSPVIRLTVGSTAYADPHQRNIKVCITGPLYGEFTGDRSIPEQRASNGEKASIWWHYHIKVMHGQFETSLFKQFWKIWGDNIMKPDDAGTTAGPLLLIWSNFNPSMDKKLHPL